MPIYFLPAYEDADNRPATPPPPYTPLQPAPLLSDPPDEAPVCPLAVSIPVDDDEAPEATQIQSRSANSQNKDLTPGRYRRFTGDSGIEVCDGQDLWDQQDLFEEVEMLEEEGTRELEEQQDDCDSHSVEHNHVGATVDTPVASNPQPKSLWWSRSELVLQVISLILRGLVCLYNTSPYIQIFWLFESFKLFLSNFSI